MIPYQAHSNSESDAVPPSERNMSLRGNEKSETFEVMEPSKGVKTEQAGSSKATSNSEAIDQYRDRDRCEMTSEAFQLILRERSLEKIMEAKEEQLEGLKRTNMQSTSGSNKHPLELFPNEIWVMILNCLKPDDRVNMYHVHTLFRDLMEDTFIQDTLFPLVMDFQIPLVKMYLAPCLGLGRSPDLKELMNLRRVCKSLRDCVDKWIKDRLLNKMRNYEPAPASKLNSVRLKMSSKYLGDVSRPCRPHHVFLRSLEVVISPFWEGSHRFDDDEDEDEERNARQLQQQRQIEVKVFNDFKDYVTGLLENCGNQILHFDLNFFGVNEIPLSLDEIHRILKDWLLLMPNVKWLVLKAVDVGRLENQLNWMAAGSNEEMPTLPKLESINFLQCDEHCIWNPVLIANPQVKYHSQLRSRPLTDIDTYTDPAVLSLSLETIRLGGRSRQHWDLPLLQRISANNWNLKRVTMWMAGKNGYDSLDDVFRWLQRYQSLEDVELHIDHVSICEEINFLRLPNLRNFWIEFGPKIKSSGERDFFFSLQFLLYCSKLNTVIWENVMYDSLPVRRRFERVGCSDGIMLDFKGGNVDLSGSNVWEVFPQMKTIKVRFREGKDEKTRKYYRRVYQDRKLVKEDKCKWKPLFYYRNGSMF